MRVQLFGNGKGKAQGKAQSKGKVMSKHEKQSEEDVPCIYCSTLYSESSGGEVGIKCQTCNK